MFSLKNPLKIINKTGKCRFLHIPPKRYISVTWKADRNKKTETANFGEYAKNAKNQFISGIVLIFLLMSNNVDAIMPAKVSYTFIRNPMNNDREDSEE